MAMMPDDEFRHPIDPTPILHKIIRLAIQREASFALNPTANFLVVSVDSVAHTVKIKRKGDRGHIGCTVPYDASLTIQPYTTSGGTDNSPAPHSRVEVLMTPGSRRVTRVLN